MVLGLRDLAAFSLPSVSPTAVAESMHEYAGGLRQMAQLRQQREIADQQTQLGRDQLAQRQVEERNQMARSAADQIAQSRAAEAQRREQRRTRALSAFGEFTQALKAPGGAARAETQLPALQANGVSWKALPDGSYGFVFGADEGPGENWGTIPLSQLSADDKAATERMLSAAVRANTARTPSEVGAAGAEAVASDPTLAGKEALEAYAGATNPQLGRLQSDVNSRRSAAAMAAGRTTPGQSGRDMSRQDIMATHTLRRFWFDKVQQNADLRGSRQRLAEAHGAREKLQSGNPLDENDALIARIKANMGSRFTDKDLEFSLRDAGLVDRWKNAFSKNIMGQGVSEEYADLLTRTFDAIEAHESRKISAAARQVGDAIARDTLIRQQAGEEIQASLANEIEQFAIDFARGAGGGGSPTAEPPPMPEGYDPNDPSTWPEE